MRHRLSYGYPEPEQQMLGKRYLEVGDGHFAWVDEVDYEAVYKYKWALDKNGEPSTQLPCIDGGNKKMTLKSMLFNYRAERGMCLKYLDGNALNNSRDNIKRMTLSEARALDKKLLGPALPRKWKVKSDVRKILV